MVAVFWEQMKRRAGCGICAALLCAGALLAPAGRGYAGEGASSAIARPGNSPAFLFYLDFTEAGEIVSRLGKSATLSHLLGMESDFASTGIENVLADIPATELALLFTVDESGDEIGFQMALRYGKEYEPLLRKVAAVEAGPNAIRELLGVSGSPLGGLISSREPDASGYNFYMLQPFGLSFSAAGDTLILGYGEEAVRASLSSFAGNRDRFAKRLPDEKNVMIVRANKTVTDMLISEFGSGNAENPPEDRPHHLSVRCNLSLGYKSWNLDADTNLLALAFGRELAQGFTAGRMEPVFSPGRLLAATARSRQSAKLVEAMHMNIFDQMQTLFLPRALRGEPGNTLLAGDMNLVLADKPGDAGDVRAYVMFSGLDYGGKVGAEIDSLLRGAHGAEAQVYKDVPGWDTVYSLPLGGWFASPPKRQEATLAVAGDRILFGGMPHGALAEPSTPGSDFYRTLVTEQPLAEYVYLDMRHLRQAFRAINMPPDHWARGLIKFAFIATMDFHEIGVQTFSAERFRLKFRTGWLDFDGRDLIKSL